MDTYPRQAAIRSPDGKFVVNYNLLAKLIEARRAWGDKIVTTIGTWDMLHIGHVRYLNAARKCGDLLVVGVDSDKVVARYKGPHRPIIPEGERIEMLTYLDCVDLIALVNDVDKEGIWYCGLIAVIHPDIYIAVEDSYPESQLEEIKKYCGELIILPRQAQNTSSTQIIQKIIKANPEEFGRLVRELSDQEHHEESV